MSERLREDTIAIWRAGVAAVDSEKLVRDAVRVADGRLVVAGESIPLDEVDRVVVLGAGKAGAGMAAGIVGRFDEAGALDRLSGWVNVPEDCVRAMPRTTLHGARPAGVNEPTEAGVAGTERILEIAESLGPRDVAVVLISGGGSALLPAPVTGVSLGEKREVTRLLMHGGATINELNTVRKQLSRVKGGGLARAAAGARRIFTLIVSDVVGDPLEVIASGPTVADESTADDALAILDRLGGPDAVPVGVVRHLESHRGEPSRSVPDNVSNHVIGNNAVAVEAAGVEAARRGYKVRVLDEYETGIAWEIGTALAERCRSIRDARPASPVCLLTGGEPIVQLAKTDRPRKGGRNQEVALAATRALWEDGAMRIVVLSGGTDGEDGPTNAAGGIADADVIATAKSLGLDPDAHLAINDAYPFLHEAGGLLVTGPTHTNVMDLRVALVE